jgi:CHAD domain-containing protein
MRSALGSYIMPVLTRRSELLKARLDRFSRVLHGVEKGDIRALHRARVASRRLRELLQVLQLEHGTAHKLNRRLRRVTSRLGTVRELDVLMLLVDELHISRRNRSAPIGRVGVAIAKARDSRLHANIDQAGAVYLPERLHDVRIGVKKLRYAFELAAEAAGAKREGELRMLRRGQEILGRMHDLQMLIDRVRDVQASLAPPSLAVWRELDEVVASLDEDCRRLHARYMRARTALLVLADRLARGQGAQKQTPTRGQTPAGSRRGLTATAGTSARRVS